MDSREQQCYLSLAVFPEDTPIPEIALQTYWKSYGLSKYDVQDVINALIDRSLAHRNEDGAITLHDLQYDYIRTQSRDIFGLHKQLLHAYASEIRDVLNSELLLEQVHWSELPRNDTYVWNQILKGSAS